MRLNACALSHFLPPPDWALTAAVGIATRTTIAAGQIQRRRRGRGERSELSERIESLWVREADLRLAGTSPKPRHPLPKHGPTLSASQLTNVPSPVPGSCGSQRFHDP